VSSFFLSTGKVGGIANVELRSDGEASASASFRAPLRESSSHLTFKAASLFTMFKFRPTTKQCDGVFLTQCDCVHVINTPSFTHH
jgi:hypothetical protein